jgi:hypothetical protein
MLPSEELLCMLLGGKVAIVLLAAERGVVATVASKRYPKSSCQAHGSNWAETPAAIFGESKG